MNLKILNFIMFLVCFEIQNMSCQNFSNLDFEQSCDTSKTSLCHWDLSWNYKALIGHDNSDKNSNLFIEGTDLSSIGFVEQVSIIPPSSKLKIITITGKIKTKNIEGKGAGLSISILDEQGNYLFSDYMGNRSLNAITGSNPWEEFSMEAVCDPKSYIIKIGGIFYGKGKAWFDDFNIKIELVENRKPNDLSKEYLDHLFKIVEKHSLMRDSVDFKTLKNESLRIAGEAKKYSDCHKAVQYLINSLGDHHSFLMKPEAVKKWQIGDIKNEEDIEIKLATYEFMDSFGYISLPGFHSNHLPSKIQYIDTIQHALKYFDQSNVKGWIVDLRENDGGNMEPMLAGLGPLFNAEELGYLIDVEGNKEPWGYKNNSPFSGEEVGTSASFPIKLMNQNLPIAVITGPKTGSSGEIVVISFIGNKNTKSFGKPTFGISTGNGEFDLLDGSKLFLTSTIMADRNGIKYGGKIYPDFEIENTSETEDLELIEAIKWLKKNTKG